MSGLARRGPPPRPCRPCASHPLLTGARLCGRYKAFLAWHRVPTKVVDTLPIGRDGPPRTVVDGAEVQPQDMVAMVTAAGATRAGAAAAMEESHWVKEVDEKLIPYVFVNVFRSPDESAQAMAVAVKRGDYNAVLATMLTRLGYFYNYSSAKLAKRQFDPPLTAHTGERIKIIELLNAWHAAIGSRPALGGAEPNMADFAVFGALASLEGLDTHQEVMAQAKVAAWYKRMADAIAQRAP